MGPGKDLERLMLTRAAKKFDRKELIRPSTSLPIKPSNGQNEVHNRRRSTKLEQSDDLLQDLEDIHFGHSCYPH